ncbi:hypothetical protein [Pseudoflavonifractor phocaeensis]|uniref:hypothetical protein n=1 Tax=Pseudoflavonifractor phocaeensis TaxID=1870988 RepID=UPI00195614A6|nr:hypothetical protein [Pseudoflavonifractor phocaeensis]MBM6926937.1 hypothetical protein [Pseudoflavonifractor phocaeensis]
MKTSEKVTPRYREVRAKQDIMRDRYGGMMELKDIATELGYKSPTSARAAVREMGLPATQVGRKKKYDTDIVARRLVELRGNC